MFVPSCTIYLCQKHRQCVYVTSSRNKSLVTLNAHKIICLYCIEVSKDVFFLHLFTDLLHKDTAPQSEYTDNILSL